MVFRVYVEKKPGFDVEAQQLGTELRPSSASKACARCASSTAMTWKASPRSSSTRPRLPCSASRRWTTSTPTCLISATHGVRRRVPARPVRPARRFRQRVHPADLPGRASDRALRQGVCAGRRLSEADVEAIKHYVINPVEAREASLDVKTTLKTQVPVPGKVEVIDGFTRWTPSRPEVHRRARSRHGSGRPGVLPGVLHRGAARAHDHRDQGDRHLLVRPLPSHHVRHRTGRGFESTTPPSRPRSKYLEMRHELGRDAKPVCLMDMGTIGAKWLKKNGILKISTNPRRSTPAPSR